MSEIVAIHRVLVANRGEIARRVMRTCRRLGIETVAVFSDADANAAFVQDADYSVGLGGNTPAESYLRIDAIIDAVRTSGADAVHPGYGFLAENAEFAEAVAAAGAIFIGPTPAAIRSMGSKLEAKRLMAEAAVPLLPSVELGPDADAAAECETVGYPILIKASAGGGGRGMRVVQNPADLDEAIAGARRESASAFGDDTIYAERYVYPSRHVEVQIFGDVTGNVIHLYERDCSIQRRHQKIIEEAPAPTINDEVRAKLFAAAIAAGEAIGYTNAGTVEFLLAPTGEFFFLEVNTRLQVEHPVTEAIVGHDLVELQLAVASGAPLPKQDEVPPPQGHAIEVRLYAEDPTQNYLPSTGEVTSFRVPDSVRVDSALDADGGIVSQFYDPMIAKVVAHGFNREAAIQELAAALRRTSIDGIRTNRDLLVRTLTHHEFMGTDGDSGFLDRWSAAELGRPLIEGPTLDRYAAAAALARQARNRERDPHLAAASSGFRNVATAAQWISLRAHDDELRVEYRFGRHGLDSVSVDGRALENPRLWAASPTAVDLSLDGVRQQLDVAQAHTSTDDRIIVTGPEGSVDFRVQRRFVEPGELIEPGSLVATMPGTIVAVHIEMGATVTKGQPLIVMEAMKMELAIEAPNDGVVTQLAVVPGDTVTTGDVLAFVSHAEPEPA